MSCIVVDCECAVCKLQHAGWTMEKIEPTKSDVDSLDELRHRTPALNWVLERLETLKNQAEDRGSAAIAARSTADNMVDYWQKQYVQQVGFVNDIRKERDNLIKQETKLLGRIAELQEKLEGKPDEDPSL